MKKVRKEMKVKKGKKAKECMSTLQSSSWEANSNKRP